VDAATEEGVAVHGVSDVFYIPSVLRLRRYARVPRRVARCTRTAVLRRDRYTCAYCGARPGERPHIGGRSRILSRSDMTIDHIVPSSRGGQTTWTNTVCACRFCNQRKGDRTPKEAGMRLHWKPVLPHSPYGLVFGDMPSEWQIYQPWQSPGIWDTECEVM